MHEQSLVRTLLKQVDAIRREHGADQIREVRVEVGPLSGVEPLLLESAFDQLAAGTFADGATLAIDEVTLQAECRSCRQQFEVDAFDFRCPDCGGHVRILRGDELMLVSVSVACHEHAKISS